jgi:hypothetical protein
MLLNYDDSAFSFFAITVLVLYTVPAAIWILRRISSFSPDELLPPMPKVRVAALSPVHSPPRSKLTLRHHPLLQARSKLEAEKLERVRAAAPKAVLWTTPFKICTFVTLVSAVILAALTYIAMNVGQLAAYDPYAVSKSARHQHVLALDRAIEQTRTSRKCTPFRTVAYHLAVFCTVFFPMCRSLASNKAPASVK